MKHCCGNGLQILTNSLILAVKNKLLCKVFSVGNLISNGSYRTAGFYTYRSGKIQNLYQIFSVTCKI